MVVGLLRPSGGGLAVQKVGLLRASFLVQELRSRLAYLGIQLAGDHCALVHA